MTPSIHPKMHPCMGPTHPRGTGTQMEHKRSVDIAGYCSESVAEFRCFGIDHRTSGHYCRGGLSQPSSFCHNDVL